MGDIQTHYGGSVLAIVGKESVAILNDFRLGSGFITTSKNFQRVHQISPRVFIGLPYFVPDCQFVLNEVRKHALLFKLDEGRDMEPKELANFVSYLLYSRRQQPLYTAPVIAGLDRENKPYVCVMDCLGCKTEPGTFVAAGTAEQNLLGLCEILHREDMAEEELFTMGAQAFLNAVDRDALSGWGAKSYVVTADKLVARTLKGRCD